MQEAMNNLTSYQRLIVKECLSKGSGGLSLPMGSGKTLISLILALKYSKETQRPTLIVAAKTLLPSWMQEVEKFLSKYLVLGNNLVVLHGDYMTSAELARFKLTPTMKIVITTPEFIGKAFKECGIKERFIYEEEQNVFGAPIINYIMPERPFFNINTGATSIIYSTSWASLFVDEGQKYTNITTVRARGLASVFAQHKWILSGTMFYEPKVELMLGYHLIIGDKSFPCTSIPQTLQFMKSGFLGFNKTMVIRETNEMMTEGGPTLVTHIVDFEMTKDEEQLYMMIKALLKFIHDTIVKLRIQHRNSEARKFNSYMLVCLIYLRQIIVCPMLPIASAMIDTTLLEKKSELSQEIMKMMESLNLFDWANEEENAFSSRMRKAVEIIKSKDEKFLVFTSFRSCLDVFIHFLQKEDRPIFTITAKMSPQRRGSVLVDFQASTNGILLLTYDIGAEGLNIQQCRNVILMDIWWNSGKTKQAVARCLRYGQTQDVHAYFLTSNTGIENALFKKGAKKLSILEELSVGPVKSTNSSTVKMSDVIKILDCQENIKCHVDLTKRIFEKKQEESSQ